MGGTGGAGGSVGIGAAGTGADTAFLLLGMMKWERGENEAMIQRTFQIREKVRWKRLADGRL